nr:MAG TPA: hypothetical protein [Caudoviricetes sp.]
MCLEPISWRRFFKRVNSKQNLHLFLRKPLKTPAFCKKV